jgi:hypothetical protein
MFWLGTVNGDLKVRQAAALCWTKNPAVLPVLGFEVRQAAALRLSVHAPLPKPNATCRTWLVRRTKFLHYKCGPAIPELDLGRHTDSVVGL